MKFFVVVINIVLASVLVQGSIIQLDGYANAYTVFADQRLILIVKELSGISGCELLGMDAANGNVKWRRKYDHAISTAFSDNLSEIYLIEGQALISRSRENGEPIWTLDLQKLDWPSVDEDGHGIRAGERYDYEMPFASEKVLLITQKGTSGTADLRNVDSQLWVLLDRNTRRILHCGTGMFLTGTKEDMLIGLRQGYREPWLYHFTATELYKASRLLIGENEKWHYVPFPSGLSSNSKRHCTFRVRQRGKDFRFSSRDTQCAVYDVRDRSLNVFTFPPERHLQMQWANNDQWLLRFPTSVLSGKRTTDFRIESYEMNGAAKGKLALPAKPHKSKNYSRHLFFKGITQTGLFVFTDSSYDNSAPGTEIDRVLFSDDGSN